MENAGYFPNFIIYYLKNYLQFNDFEIKKFN